MFEITSDTHIWFQMASWATLPVVVRHKQLSQGTRWWCRNTHNNTEPNAIWFQGTLTDTDLNIQEIQVKYCTNGNCNIPATESRLHRENSPVTQTTPEPTLSSWGGWPREKCFPPPLATRQAWSYRGNRATQTLLFSKSFDLAQVCHGNKICSKPVLTWKLTLVLAFPAHCISN